MRPPDYHAQFERLIEEVRRHPGLSLDDGWVRPGLSEDRIDRLAQQADLVLPDALRAFFRSVDGAHLAWSLAPSADVRYRMGYAESIGGCIRLATLDELLAPPGTLLDSAWSAALDDPDALDDLGRFHPFDDPVEETFAGYLEDDGRLLDELFYLELDSAVVGSGGGLPEYWQAMMAARGIVGWQNAYIYPPDDPAEDDALFYLAQLFPDASRDAFRR